MNENIRIFLDCYIEDPDPQYGVLIDGAWGCGKTFFIQSWLKGLANDESCVMKPIEVSLFGLNQVSQINDAINMVLFPVLDNKYYKIAKSVVGTVSKAVLKCNVDIDKDGNTDGTLDIQLDPLMTLFNSQENINKEWFFVFDDIERCNIDMKSLFGYINDFVERRQFHVIIICNSNEISQKDKPVFAKFKEKVIGRSFVVQPDVSAAVDSFLHKVPSNDFTLSNAKVIEKVFWATGFNNLRVIRQAIRDCNRILENQKITLDNEYQCIGYRNFLIRCIVITMELAKGNESLLHGLCLGPVLEKTLSEQERKDISTLRSKYDNLGKEYKINVLDTRHIDILISNIKEGESLDNYLYWQVKDLEMPSWKKLENYLELSNEEFERLYDEVEDVFYNASNEELGVDSKISIIYLFLHLEDIGIREVSDKFYRAAIDYFEMLVGNLRGSSDFNSLRSIKNQQSRFFTEEGVDICEHRNEFEKVVNNMFLDQGNMIFNMVTQLLENLTFENVSKLDDMLDEKDPGMDKIYRDIPYFKYVDVEKVASGILNADNRTRKAFYTFLDHRYGFSAKYVLSEEMKAESDKLEEIKHILNESIDGKELVDKRLINMIITAIIKILTQK